MSYCILLKAHHTNQNTSILLKIKIIKFLPKMSYWSEICFFLILMLLQMNKKLSQTKTQIQMNPLLNTRWGFIESEHWVHAVININFEGIYHPLRTHKFPLSHESISWNCMKLQSWMAEWQFVTGWFMTVDCWL